jgi:protease-4
LATGQIFTAKQAKEHGLIDEIGYLEAAIARAIELAGVQRADVRVVEYERPLSLTGVLLGAESRAPGIDLAALVTLATPRVYYLTTLLPAVMSAGAAR